MQTNTKTPSGQGIDDGAARKLRALIENMLTSATAMEFEPDAADVKGGTQLGWLIDDLLKARYCLEGQGVDRDPSPPETARGEKPKTAAAPTSMRGAADATREVLRAMTMLSASLHDAGQEQYTEAAEQIRIALGELLQGLTGTEPEPKTATKPMSADALRSVDLLVSGALGSLDECRDELDRFLIGVGQLESELHTIALDLHTQLQTARGEMRWTANGNLGTAVPRLEAAQAALVELLVGAVEHAEDFGDLDDGLRVLRGIWLAKEQMLTAAKVGGQEGGSNA